MYYFLLIVLPKLGFQKMSVKLAYRIKKRATATRNARSFGVAQRFLYISPIGFPRCSKCSLPILSETEARHAECRPEIQLEINELLQGHLEYERLQVEWDAQHLADLLASFCTEAECYEEGDPYDGKCIIHAPEEACHDCGKLGSLCRCADEDDDPYDDGMCQGDCGQPANCCTCAELASWRRHNANPETRGSTWVA